MRMIGDRLVGKGFSVSRGYSIKASSSSCVIHCDPMGLCWSSTDPSDYLLPSIPEILGCKKEITTPSRLLGMYFGTLAGGRGPVLRANLRLESSRNWDHLRSSGSCGLAPDEHLLARLLLGGARGTCPVVTDFAVEGSFPYSCGRRLYFRSRLSSSEISETLRVAGSKKGKNSYLPRDGLLPLGYFAPGGDELAAGLGELGEWCSYATA